MDNFLYSRNSLKYQGLDIQGPVVRRPIIANLDFNLHRAKKVVSDSPGLVDIAIGLVNSVLNLPNVQVKFFWNSNYRRTVKSSLLIKTLLGLVEMMFGLVNVSFSLPEWQAVKMTFFAP